MAQTKKASTRRSGSSKSSGSKSSGSPGSKSAKSAKSSNGSTRAKGSTTKAKSSTTKAKSQAKRSPGHVSSNGAGSADAVKDAVKNGAEGAADIVRKAKVPLVASSAAVAGVAGAVVLSRTGGKRRKVLGVSVPKRSKLSLPTKKAALPKVHMPNGDGLRGDARKIAGALTDAAKRADRLGQQVSSVASSVQKVGETASDAAKKA